MKRFGQYFGTLVAIVALWLGLELQRASLGSDSALVVKALHLSPLLAVLAAGLGCACKLAFDICTFNDYSAAEIPALGRDIAAAKADLHARGFTD